MEIAEQVQAAIQSTATGDTGQTPEERVTYALGWIVANVIVAARYHDAAIDALPVYHPEHGWDRFLLTRRVSCALCADEAADHFGLIMLDGEDAPRLTHPNGETRIALGHLLRTAPLEARARILSFFPPTALVAGDHSACWHQRAERYPMLFSVVSDLIVSWPAIVAAREIYIDDAQIDGAYHPLYIHTALRAAHHVYDWFAVQTQDYPAYFRINGEQAIYLTDANWWSTVVKPLSAERSEDLAGRILAWLRLRGQPDPAVD
jgi:hypothetical protein